MSHRNFSSPAWLLHGLFGSTAGALTLQDERLSFVKDDGQTVFDVPIGEASEIKYPWHLFGGGLTLRVGAENYRVSFVRPGNTAGAEGNLGDVAVGRQNCKKWKSALPE